MSDQNENLEAMTKQLLSQESTERRALSMLLDRYTTTKNKLFVQRGEMGGTESFIGSVSLQWFAERVGFASQLPLFKDKIDPETGKIVIDKTTINDVLQRPIDYTRQAVLAQYLAASSMPKFPAVLVVLSQDWVDDPEADEWNADGRAVRSAADFQSLDSSGQHGLLDVSESMRIFALDGQHRLSGIIGLMELIKTGRLPIKDTKGNHKKGAFLTVEDIQRQSGVSQSKLQSLANERIGIEFLSAVIPGEDRERSKRRIRSVFVHVNKMAAALTPGQLHQLDEDNGFALVAKNIAVSHPFLEVAGRVNMDNNTISGRSTAFTTLQTLKEMADGFLAGKYADWGPSKSGLIPMRPDDESLEEAHDLMLKLMDGLITVPTLERVKQGTGTPLLRNFAHEFIDKEQQITGEGNLLMRPVGQQVVAGAFGALVFRNPPMQLEILINKLVAFDVSGGFSGIDSASSPWFGVLYKPQRMFVGGKNLAIRLLVYILSGGLEDEAREQLRIEYAKARSFDGREEKAMDINGDLVGLDKIKLPDPI